MKKRPRIDETKYRGQWVALDPRTYRVVSHDPVFKKARARAKRRGIERPLMHGVPKSDGYFIGGGHTFGA
ncbi:MAG: hypothetical protein HY372_01485 [Candidatus Andersenbacteria bacterium]|nr:hypothetical protein [Candidatus Andersenbacteria bacterium]